MIRSVGRCLPMLLAGALAGCAGSGVVAADNPDVKLSDARDLIVRQERPLPADPMILEAMGIYRRRNDEKGLAKAYLGYAELLESPAVATSYANIIHQQGFGDGTPFDRRFQKSVDYLNKARDTFVRLKFHEGICNADFQMGIAFENMKQSREACAAYSLALADFRDYAENDPHAKIDYPPQFSSFDESIAAQQKRVGCP